MKREMLPWGRRMNREASTPSVYSDARTEYTKQLCVFLVPAYFTFFVNLLEECKRTQEPRRVLWQFQTLLNEIHDWNMEKVKHEIQVIQTNCGCDYLEDLLTAVCIAHTKVLTAIRLSSNRSKVEITVPKVDHFLFKALCETAKLLWSNTYLFRDGISSMDKQQNYRAVEGILNEGIIQAIRSMVPVKSILKDMMSGQMEAADVDSDEDTAPMEPLPVESPLVPAQEAPISQVMIPSEPTVSIEPVIAPIAAPVAAPIEPVITPVAVPVAAPIEPVSLVQSAPVEPANELQAASPPIIMLDEKPNVQFGAFDAVFHEDGDESDMIYDPKEDDPTPVLEFMDDAGASLGVDDFESLDAPMGGPQNMEADDYEEL